MSPNILIERAIERLTASSAAVAELLLKTETFEQVQQLALVSDFAIDTLCRQTELLPHLLNTQAAPLPIPVLDQAQPTNWHSQLRLYRNAESTRLIWRDVLGLDDVAATLAGSTQLAQTCLQIALAAAAEEFALRHGVVRAADGSPQQMVVFGLGKLGGEELNFSSDVDLVYAYPQNGESDGTRALAAEDYFARLGQRLARLLDDTTADGFCHRVDLRLRPFGNAGRVALSFRAMDQYFQSEGRDWERYAWLKARAVAGDIKAGENWLQSLRPFIYRRYLDFTALDGLREMKAAIAAEVTRRELAEDIKRGPGGIREIEFLVQSLQLIRGGREPALCQHGLIPALQALIQAGHITKDIGEKLATSYCFLRQLENRLQMLRDAQTHELPEAEDQRQRIATGLGYSDWLALYSALQTHRKFISTEFAALLKGRERDTSSLALINYWRTLSQQEQTEQLTGAGFADAHRAHIALQEFANSTGVKALSDKARARLDRILPTLLEAATGSAHPDAALKRLLGLLQAILRRASYLALLDEQPSAMARLVNVLSRSAFLAERLTMYPLLLDELLDSRISSTVPDAEGMREQCAAVLQIEDPENALRSLNEIRQALSFRIALATLDQRQPGDMSTRQMAWLADAVVKVVLQMARAEMEALHGEIPQGVFAVIGYGSLGGSELGFGSDLDLVFLYDHPAEIEQSTGVRALEPNRWFSRLAQKLIALLSVETAAGRLYEIDVRLRPDGSTGLLVSSLTSYSDYQRTRAWTWEHQALVRARAVAGDTPLMAAFEQLREQVLIQPRQPTPLCEEITQMRVRMQAELDRSNNLAFDIKQGAGGLVDLEFLLQYLVLAQAQKHPQLCQPRNTAFLIDALHRMGSLHTTQTTALQRAHSVLLAAGLACTLDRRPRLTVMTEALIQARTTVTQIANELGLAFQPNQAH